MPISSGWCERVKTRTQCNLFLQVPSIRKNNPSLSLHRCVIERARESQSTHFLCNMASTAKDKRMCCPARAVINRVDGGYFMSGWKCVWKVRVHKKVRPWSSWSVIAMNYKDFNLTYWKRVTVCQKLSDIGLKWVTRAQELKLAPTNGILKVIVVNTCPHYVTCSKVWPRSRWVQSFIDSSTAGKD